MKARFEVSTEGMRELQAGREPWQLAKELVSNAWDESTTKCNVFLKSIAPRKARLNVYDDGGGFTDIKDAWTLLGHTPKRLNPTVRGRFNIGEKEILSVAIRATIKTSGKIITFPKTGGRQVRNSTNGFKGTSIECWLPWGPRQVDTTVEKLKTLLTPKGITYTVNGCIIPHQEPSQTVEATLDTILQLNINEPMRPTRRKTTLELHPAEKGYLYEMGIPIHNIECPFLVNVMQKVPMPPNRDVVRDSYLQDIYAIVLNATAPSLEEEQVSATWVRLGIEDKEADPDAVKTIMNKRYGDKVILWSNDMRANEQAEQAGYEVIHGRTLSSLERQQMEGIGLQHTSDVFKVNYVPADVIPQSEWTEGMKLVADYAQMLAYELNNKNIKVVMYRLPNGGASASYNTLSSELSFNVSVLGKAWFSSITWFVTSLILHEISHTNGDWHNHDYLKHFEKLAGKAVHLALNKPKLFPVYK